MIASIRRIKSSPASIKVAEWLKLLTVTGSAQTLIQGIGLVTGILVIRLLSTQEYALYTLVNTMLGTLTVLADGGISTGVFAQGGKVWTNRRQLGVVLVTGMKLRKKFAIASLLVSLPILVYLLRHHGASWVSTILLVLALVPAFVAALSDSLLEIAPKLKQDVVSLQKNQVSANAGRLLLIGFSVFLFPWAFVAVLGNGLPRLWANIRLRKISARHADWSQEADPQIRKEVIKTVKRVLPGSIYYCLSGQISIWIISLVGSTTALASLGALGRISMMMTVFGSVFGTLVIPRFARMPEGRGLLLKRFLQILLAILVMDVCILAVIYFFPTPLLWVLGHEYQDLQKELFLSVAASCIAVFGGSIYGLCASRNWIINPAVFILVNVLAVVCGALLVDVSTLIGVLHYNLFIVSVDFLVYLIYVLLKIWRLNA